jgi:hypothetical protein
MDARVAALEAEVRALRAEQNSEPDGPRSRRGLLKAAVVAAGAVAAGGVAAKPAAAADGSPLLLGSANNANNTATTTTTLTYIGAVNDVGALVIKNNANFDIQGPGPISLTLNSPGAHLRFIAEVGDAILGTYPDGTLAYNGGAGLFLFVSDGSGGTRPVLLANPETADAFRLLPSAMRVYDSRTGTGPAANGAGKIGSGQSREVSVTQGFVGNQPAELFPPPSDGVMLNLTITETEGSGFLSVFDAAVPFSGTSNINWSTSNQNLANFAVTPTTGFVTVLAGGSGATHFVIDVVGAYG